MSESSPAQLGPYTPQQLLMTSAEVSVWIAAGKPDPGGGAGGGKQVVLKVPRGEDGRKRMRREAELLATMDHPNLIRRVDAARDGAWLALERVPGVTIDQWSHGRPVDDILGAGLQLVSAVAYLHARGLVHGDLKPASILVTPGGHLSLADLGLAAGEGASKEAFRGTLGFAAPEVLSGRSPTAATDRYGLGGVLYCCLTGRTPFSAPDPAALTYLPLVSLPSPPAAWRPEIPATLNQLLLGLLARDPDRRPSDLERVAEVLERGREQPFGTPVLGMEDEREELRRAVVGAADGETRVAVLYGVPGSGRRTLIAEAVEHARREGLPYLKGADPQAVLSSVRGGSTERPPVTVMKASHAGARNLAEVMLAEKLRGLLLLLADRPVPGLAAPMAIQLTPAPLEMHDAARLVRLYQADPGLAEAWSRQSMGLPAAILGRIRAWMRANGLTFQQDGRLPADAQKIYDALHTHAKAVPVPDLAAEVSMTEHQLLDHCEVLFAEDLVQSTDDGRALLVKSA